MAARHEHPARAPPRRDRIRAGNSPEDSQPRHARQSAFKIGEKRRQRAGKDQVVKARAWVSKADFPRTLLK